MCAGSWKFEYVPDEAGGEPTVVIYLTLVPNRMQMRVSPRAPTGSPSSLPS